MNLRTLIIAITLVIVTTIAVAYYVLSNPSSFFPAKEEKQFVIGVITNPPSLDPAWNGFQQGMKARGYEEGKTIIYLVTPAGNNFPDAKKVLENMVEKDIDALYVMGSLAGRAAREVTAARKPTLPVVFGVISDPVGVGLVKSFQSSGTNFTGITPVNETIVSKRLEALLELVPNTKRIIFVWFDPQTSGIENLRKVAKTLEVELVEKQVQDVSDAKAFFNSYSFKPGDAILRASDSATGSIIKDIVAFALEEKVPLAGNNIHDVELGALMSYGANHVKIGEQAARLMDSVLKGAKPSDLPIELADQFEFVINAKTADALNLIIPPASLNKANRVIR